MAGASDGTVQTGLWVAAIVICYAGPYVTGVEGFTVHPPHFVERHGLIVIIALGESIVAIGAWRRHHRRLGARRHRLAVMALVAGLWWDYFTRDAEAGEEPSLAADGHERARLARDVYSYLHVPLVLGIVFAAVGIHEVLAHTPSRSTRCSPGLLRGRGALLRRAGGHPGAPGDRPGGPCLAAVAGRPGADPRRPADVDALVTTSPSPPSPWGWRCRACGRGPLGSPADDAR